MIDQLGNPISAASLAKGAPVVSGQGDAVGSVHVVLLEGEELDGLVIDRTVEPLGLSVVEADEVKGLFERGVVLGLSTMQCQFLPRPDASPEVEDPHERSVLRRAWAAVSGL